jgi:tubulin--tyrosine ligase-like protein 12
VNDEVGSAIEHSDTANVKLVPFLYSEDNKLGQNMFAYSILWPVKDITAGELLYRDWLHGYTEEKQRSSRLAIWYKLPTAFF